MWQLISDRGEKWQTLDDRIAAFDDEFVALARADEATRRRYRASYAVAP